MTRQGTWSPGNSTPPSQTSGGRQTSPTPGTGIESMAPEYVNFDPESYPLLMTSSLLFKMAIEIVGLPIKHGDFP